MELTKQYLKTELEKIHALLFSGSLHEVDEANNIASRLLKELDV